MKYYSRGNYDRYKKDLRLVKDVELDLTDSESIVRKYIKLPEYIARQFPLKETSCGRLTIEDLIQEGMVALCIASKKIDSKIVKDSDNQDLVIKAYLSQRISGHINRVVINSRGTIRVPESAVLKMRSQVDEDVLVRQTFFENVLQTIEEQDFNGNMMVVDSGGELKEYNYNFVVAYVLGVLKTNLSSKEYYVLKNLYGIGCLRKPMAQIGIDLGLNCSRATIFSIKERAIKKIEGKIKRGEIIDFLF